MSNVSGKLIISHIITSVFLIGVICVLYFGNKSCPKAIVRTEYIYDTVKIEKTNYVPVPGSIEKNVCTSAEIDTAKIIEDYFAKLYYADTLINDTTAFIVVKDSVRENRIISRSFEYQNHRPIQIVNTAVNQPNNKFRFGAGVAIGGNRQKFELAPGLMVSKNKNTLTLSYDLYCKSVRVGWYYCFK